LSRAQQALDELEDAWRGRVDRMSLLLADPLDDERGDER
jgi:hypothetical protein